MRRRDKSGMIVDNFHQNGIACPQCGAELVDSKPNTILAGIPPKKNIHCVNPECDYKGFRIA